ncbi:hypothetical protein R5W24_000548 [Gemmata sp. JC717]|uniref:hypothetical protein n=1 Tax=Gemmata algarum TaxID=2975278 RepID=UPI0021BB48D9|nr:hypothetical protein [Gemmata algarum]MDY3551472.1 hypothetical protein [Gemmata algarum]
MTQIIHIAVVDARIISPFPGYYQTVLTHPDGTVEKSPPQHTVCVGHDHCIYCGRVFEAAAPRWKERLLRWWRRAIRSRQ